MTPIEWLIVFMIVVPFSLLLWFKPKWLQGKKVLTRPPKKNGVVDNTPVIPKVSWYHKFIGMFWENDKERRNLFIVIIIIFSIHWIIWASMSEWYKANIGWNLTVWLLHPLLIWFAVMMVNSNTPFHRKTGSRMLTAVIIAMLFAIFGEQLESTDNGAPASNSSVTTPASNAVATNYLAIAGDPVTKARTIAVWMNESGLSPADAVEMIAIAGCESGFRQFEGDGITPYHVRDDPKTPEDESKLNVIGVMQIHIDGNKGDPDLDLGKGSKFDPETLEGNLKAAQYIRMKYGAEKWVCLEKVRMAARATNLASSGTVTVTAPVGTEVWSQVVSTPGSAFIYPEGPVRLRTSDGRILNTDKGVTWDIGIGRTTTLEFQSRGTEAINVTVKR